LLRRSLWTTEGGLGWEHAALKSVQEYCVKKRSGVYYRSIGNRKKSEEKFSDVRSPAAGQFAAD